jgi:hypothetical protein
VPLRTPDPDILINLSEVYSTAYDRGRLQRRIDYRGATPTQLHADEVPWVKDVLKRLY